MQRSRNSLVARLEINQVISLSLATSLSLSLGDWFPFGCSRKAIYNCNSALDWIKQDCYLLPLFISKTLSLR
jgi:hypothetical protein